MLKIKYSVKYYKDFRYFAETDEIILKYNSNRTDIIDFIKENYTPEQRIILDVSANLSSIVEKIPVFKKMQEENILFSVETSVIEYKTLKEEGIPFFFTEFCETLDELYSFIKCGVTDVYIVEELCFNLEKVSTYCHSKNVNVRVFPNIAQCNIKCKENIPPICKFFIRPEDTKYYEEYVDIFEFAGKANKMSTYFEVYKNKKWDGDLDILILDLGKYIPNNGLIPPFGKNRIKCQHNCMLEKCFLCIQDENIAQEFEKNNFSIVNEKDRTWKKQSNTFPLLTETQILDHMDSSPEPS